MPRRTPYAAVLRLALALLLAALPLGCAKMPRMLGGSGDLTLTLDGEQNHEASLPAGRTLTLDLRDPAASGYVIAGTSFDPVLLRLEGIEPRDRGRLRYVFAAVAPGQAEIQIKIRKNEPGYPPDVFKRVRVEIAAR